MPLPSSDFDDLVRSLYEAALDPAAWTHSLQKIAALSGADNIHFMAWNPEHAQPAFSLAPGMDEGIEAQYRDYFGAIDPRRLLVAQRPMGDWLACHQHFSAGTVDRSEFFQDYLIPGGCRYLLGTRLVRHAQHDVFLGMHRAPGRKPFQASDIAGMQRLTGYLQHASRIWLDTETLRQQAALGNEAMNAVELGILATDARGTVQYANRYGEALLRTGAVLKMVRGRLTAAAYTHQETLQAALQRADATGESRNLRLEAASAADAQACHVVVVPLGSSGPLGQGLRPASLLVLLRDTRHHRLPTTQQIMALFGLSPAEARLARAICAGETLDDVARINGVTMNTVKRQLQNTFAKIGVQRQTDLARQLCTLPVLRHPPQRRPPS